MWGDTEQELQSMVVFVIASSPISGRQVVVPFYKDFWTAYYYSWNTFNETLWVDLFLFSVWWPFHKKEIRLASTGRTKLITLDTVGPEILNLYAKSRLVRLSLNFICVSNSWLDLDIMYFLGFRYAEMKLNTQRNTAYEGSPVKNFHCAVSVAMFETSVLVWDGFSFSWFFSSCRRCISFSSCLFSLLSCTFWHHRGSVKVDWFFIFSDAWERSSTISAVSLTSSSPSSSILCFHRLSLFFVFLFLSVSLSVCLCLSLCLSVSLSVCLSLSLSLSLSHTHTHTHTLRRV